MLPSAQSYRLDWRREFERLSPYLKGRRGVVRIDFTSEEAAPAKFNHILKEDFAEPSNKTWLSLRIDAGWSTTYTADDLVHAFATKLAEGGIAVHFPSVVEIDGDLFSGNSAGGDLTITAPGMTVHNGYAQSPFAIRKRVETLCEAMRRFVQGGGHFMVVVNDMSPSEQQRFWCQFWHAGLAAAGGENLLLVYYVGPKCGGEPNDDAPLPDLRLNLPAAIDGNEVREAHVFDDVFDLFVADGYSEEQASMAADSIISGHGHSILAIQEGLTKLIWRMKAKGKGGGL